MSEFFTWEALLTLAGAGAATRYIVALFKATFGLHGRANHFAALAIAEIITVSAGLATGARSVEEIGLLALNGLLVAGFAIGVNENLAVESR